MACDTEDVPSAAEWRQGDIVKRVSNNDGAPFYAVISADCDIAQQKTGAAGLACLGAWPLADYLLHDYACVLARKDFANSLKKIETVINTRRRECDHTATPLTIDAIRDWVYRAADREIADALHLTQPKHRTLQEDIDSLVAAARAIQGLADGWPIAVIKALRKHRSLADAMKYALQDVNPRKLSIDIFFFSELPFEDHLGYVVKLRDLRFIESSNLFRSPHDAFAKKGEYLRVGRLTPTYRHGLAQLFGALYSRIGFHAEYEHDRDIRFELCKEELKQRMGP